MARERDEPVRLTRIYRRGGDRGETSLGDGSRVSKLDPLVRAAGGRLALHALRGSGQGEGQGGRVHRIDKEVVGLGADLSVPWVEGDGRLRIEQEAIDRLETDCDEANASLSELRSFVLPGGSEAAARLHVARALCRRAEREVLEVAGEREINPLAPVYLNRLSDLLFILARAANAGGQELLWRPGGPA